MPTLSSSPCIREEIATGKTVKSSIKIGFQKALSAIVDGNVTTLIAAIVLGFKGSGSVGFAQTLALGIIVSMFTALVVTRQVLNALYALDCRMRSGTVQSKREHRSTSLARESILYSFAGSDRGRTYLYGNQCRIWKRNPGIQPGIPGGTATTVEFNEDMSIADIDEKSFR